MSAPDFPELCSSRRATAGRGGPVPLSAALLACVAAFVLGVSAAAWAKGPAMAQAEAIIHGERIRLDVADTPELQARGLGGRERLGPNEGMAFVYAQKLRPAFWMRDMLIPIDIVFLDNDRVVHIAHDVPPPKPGTPLAELPTYRPDAPANLVIELAAGRARALGLKVGDRISLHFGVR